MIPLVVYHGRRRRASPVQAADLSGRLCDEVGIHA
jgi:hypothetical protein